MVPVPGDEAASAAGGVGVGSDEPVGGMAGSSTVPASGAVVTLASATASVAAGSSEAAVSSIGASSAAAASSVAAALAGAGAGVPRAGARVRDVGAGGGGEADAVAAVGSCRWLSDADPSRAADGAASVAARGDPTFGSAAAAAKR